MKRTLDIFKKARLVVDETLCRRYEVPTGLYSYEAWDSLNGLFAILERKHFTHLDNDLLWGGPVQRTSTGEAIFKPYQFGKFSRRFTLREYAKALRGWCKDLIQTESCDPTAVTGARIVLGLVSVEEAKKLTGIEWNPLKAERLRVLYDEAYKSMRSNYETADDYMKKMEDFIEETKKP